MENKIQSSSENLMLSAVMTIPFAVFYFFGFTKHGNSPVAEDRSLKVSN